MQTHDLEPNTPEWLAHRGRCYNASDAPAMLGCSPYVKRSDFIAQLASGITPEVDSGTQARFDEGHRIEALARPIAEEIIGDDLSVIGGTIEVPGLGRPLGASLDGRTFMGDIIWECKSLNAELRATMPHAGRDSAAKNDGRALPKDKRVQMEQQLLVNGVADTRVLFTGAKFNAAGEVEEERHCWYATDLALRAEILAGWKQAEADAAAWKPEDHPAPTQKLVAEPVEALPAPVVQVTGQIALVDNFKVFEERLREFLADKLIREPRTDEDFVNLDAQIKAMKAAREALKAAEAQMLAQVQPVDQAKKHKDMLDSLLQQNVSMAEKLLSAEKERRKSEIVAAGVKALADHVAALNQRLGKPYMPTIPADFGGAVKGLKSLASMEDKVAGELARAKIAANEVGGRIQDNLTALRELAKDHAFLFADTAQLVLKAPDDCRAVITSRIAEHAAQVQREAEAAAEKDRERIRQEEAARLAREQQEREALERRQREEADAAARRQSEAAAAPPAATAAPTPAPSPAPAPQVVNIRPAVGAKPTLKLGEINARIAPLSITADGLASLGFTATKQGNASLYREAEFPSMCDALRLVLERARDGVPQAA